MAVLAVGADRVRDGVVRDVQVARSALPVVVTPAWLARVISLGHELAVADIYWLRTLQYFGDSRYRRGGFEQLSALLGITVELDPKFCNVYRTAGLMLTSSERFDVRDADAFLARGVKECPEDVQLGVLYGFTLYYFEERYEEAGRVLTRVGALKGAPEWVGDLAVRVMSHGGQLDTAAAMLEAMLDSTEDETQRQQIEARLKRVHSEGLLREIDAATERFKLAHQRLPRDLGELVSESLLPGHPIDPLGGVITIGPDGLCVSSKMPKRLRLEEKNLNHNDEQKLNAPKKTQQQSPALEPVR